MNWLSHPIWHSQLWWFSLILFVVGLSATWLFILRHRAKLKLAKRVEDYFDKEQQAGYANDALFTDQSTESKDTAKLRQLLHKAGYFHTNAPRILVMYKLAFAASAGLLLWLSLASSKTLVAQDWFIIAALAFIANLVPEYYLKHQAEQRQKQILKALPDSLDLIAICLESGATFERSLAMVSEQLVDVYPVLAGEWQQTLRQLKLNPDRQVAFDALVERCPSPEMAALVAAVKQAEKFGSPLAQTFKSFATEMRELSKLTLEETIGKLSTKITLPMLVLVFLPLLIIILAPIGYQLFTSLQELG